MSDENVLFRSFRGVAYTSITPFILLTSSLWFSNDETALLLAHIAQVYYSIFLYSLTGIIWGLRSTQKDQVSTLSYIAFLPFVAGSIGAVTSLFFTPAWGIGMLLFMTYFSRHLRSINSQISKLQKPYADLIDKISIILCICLMIILTFWLNPYTDPLKIYN